MIDITHQQIRQKENQAFCKCVIIKMNNFLASSKDDNLPLYMTIDGIWKKIGFPSIF